MCNEFIYSEYINAIIGIIGTLLGTLLGWVLNNVSKKGKLNFYILSWKDEFQHYDKGGICVTSLNRDEAKLYSYTVHLDVYNSSAETKIMRNIQLVFFKNKKEIYRSAPNDETTRRFSCGAVRYDEIVPLNISPKSVTTLELHSCISKEEFDFIWETNKIFLSYINENNKKKKVFIKKEDYENYFINHNVGKRIMDKLKMQTVNKADENFKKLAEMFPNAVTETIDENGEVVRAIDKDILMQEISCKVVEGNEERYQFTWPDKKKSVILANEAINKTLRPCREESVDFDNTENLYIEGDNLEVLKLLQETYLGKIKMIYIDPPYNTGNDFVYFDDFSQSMEEYFENSGQFDDDSNRLVKNIDSNGRFHTDWLNMIYPRLRVAKDLLSDDGVIFISIDDNEVDNLRKICDELFGGDNFIAHIIHKNNSMKNQSKYVGVSTEFVLIYARNLVELNNSQKSWRCKKKGAEDINSIFKKLKEQGLSFDEIREEIVELYSRPKYSHLSRWNKVDELGVFMDSDLSRSNGPKNYTIINPNTGEECLIPNRGWGKSKEELINLQKEHLIWYGNDLTPPRMKSYLTEESESVFDNFIFADTSIDKKMIDKMFGTSVFEFPKSLEMMKQLVALCTNAGDIILDFFAGSSTTAHAVMQLNAEDGGNRKFIMVQLPEETDEKSEAYKVGYKNICEIGKERIRRAGKKIKEENKDKENIDKLDIGFRVLKCDSSNMKDVYYNPSEYDASLFDKLEDNIKEDRTPEDLLFQVMLDLGVLLSSKIEEKTIEGKKVFSVADDYLIACFDNNITEETVKAIAEKKPYYFVLRDSSMANDSVATNFEQIFATYSPNTIRKVL